MNEQSKCNRKRLDVYCGTRNSRERANIIKTIFNDNTLYEQTVIFGDNICKYFRIRA